MVVQAARLRPPIMLTISSPRLRLCRHAQHRVGEPRCSRKTRSTLRHFKTVDMKFYLTARPTTAPHSFSLYRLRMHTVHVNVSIAEAARCPKCLRSCWGPGDYAIVPCMFCQPHYLPVYTRFGFKSWCDNIIRFKRFAAYCCVYAVRLCVAMIPQRETTIQWSLYLVASQYLHE